LHDYIVSRRIEKLAGQIDIVHTWPLAALRTLKTAARLGIPTVLERPNTHTRFGYEVVKRECERLRVALPAGDEHEYNADILRVEEEEYQLADALLCPSDFVVKTFLDLGFPKKKLVRHMYGFDKKRFHPGSVEHKNGLTMLFVGECNIVKGLHFALEAWLQSSAYHRGTFLIAGRFVPTYAERLDSLLSHPSVKPLGHRHDIPELMRKADILVLPSLTEGFGLVVVEGMGSGCVPLVSDACTDVCKHMENALVHRVGDVHTLAQQISALDADRDLLMKLRAGALRTIPDVTWTAAGSKLLSAYSQVLANARNGEAES
jgi:glycosyltransferase involved in cell wall biosynthesis